MTNEYNGLKVYEVELDETNKTGIRAVSFVPNPAFKTEWIAMSEDMKFSTDEAKRTITAPIILSDVPVYRKIKNNELYILFRPDVIENIVKRFFMNGNMNIVNESHSDKYVDNVYMIESWITTDNDKSKSLGFNANKGSWFATFYIDDADYWNNNIINGKFKGFSLEGAFNLSKGTELLLSDDMDVNNAISEINYIIDDETINDDEKAVRLNEIMVKYDGII